MAIPAAYRRWFRAADRYKSPWPLRADQPVAATCHRSRGDRLVRRAPRRLDFWTISTGNAAGTNAGPRTSNPSWPICCSPWSCNAGSQRGVAGPMLSRRTRATRPQISSPAPRSRWQNADGPRQPGVRPDRRGRRATDAVRGNPRSSRGQLCRSGRLGKAVVIRPWSAAPPRRPIWRWRSGCGHSPKSLRASNFHSPRPNPRNFRTGFGRRVAGARPRASRK